MASLQKKATKNKRSETTCTNEITQCMTKSDKCNTDYSKCSDDKQFDLFLSTCSIQATGCNDFVTHIRKSIDKTRKTALQNAKDNVAAIVAAHQNERTKRLENIRSGCSTNTDYENCVSRACRDNTNNNCETSAEQTIANNLCQFYKTACTKIK